jgi:hypothetical protein
MSVVIDVTLFKLNSKAKILEEQKHIQEASQNVFEIRTGVCTPERIR